jgi:phosphoribulokinase
MIDDAFQSRRDPIVVPGANMELAMQLIMASVLQGLVGADRKPPLTPALSRASGRRG